MCLIPFLFVKYGDKIRSKSEFCQELIRKKAENEEKQERRWERQRRDIEKLKSQGYEV